MIHDKITAKDIPILVFFHKGSIDFFSLSTGIFHFSESISLLYVLFSESFFPYDSRDNLFSFSLIFAGLTTPSKFEFGKEIDFLLSLFILSSYF